MEKCGVKNNHLVRIYQFTLSNKNNGYYGDLVTL